jgi:phosphatidylglycerol lysyltransferase
MSLPLSPDATATTHASRWRTWLPVALALLLCGAVLLAMRSLLHEVSYADVLGAVRSTPASAIALSFAATALSFVFLAGYDWSGLRYAGAKKLPLRTVALASFCAYALGNTVGLGMLTGGAVRFRIYSAAGLDAGQIARVVGFIAAGFGAGITVSGAIALLWAAPQVSGLMHLPDWLLRGIALLVLIGAGAFLALCARRRELRLFGRWPLALPSPQLVSAQVLFSAADILASAAALWALLPPSEFGFAGVTALYAIAITLGVISHVPGGLGVFEAVVLLAYGGHAPLGQVAGALVLYRAIYFIAPLFAAMALLALYEMRSGFRATVGARVARAAARLSPTFLSTLTMIAAIMLLVSGVTPATDEATELLSLHIPLELVEASHFLGSIAGLGLLFVARGLLNRLDAAWWAAVTLTALSFWLALPKGLAVSEMLVLGFLTVMLIASRREFDRRASLFAHALSRGWILALLISMLAITWLLFFAYQDVEYTHELWWQFAFDAHAPRALRATLAVCVFGIGISMWQFFRPAGMVAGPPQPGQIDRAAAIVRGQERADACLALTGDKQFLFSESGDAFIMYGQRGRSWVSLFDPVGPRNQWRELIWRFMELAASHGGRAAFYHARPESLPLYVDAGLTPIKLGEYASVDLTTFTLKGASRGQLRQAVNRGDREGLQIELLPPGGAEHLLADLERISDEWLEQHNTREKSFSLGAFSPQYLRWLSVAVVRRGGKPVAFATLMRPELPTEATVDLMRYGGEAPKGCMDYLFVKLMVTLQAQGVQRFGLGMAPLAGLASHPLAPRWHRLGRLVFSHGEHFYNFQGLRAFKEKFEPRWEPRYLCAPGGMQSLFALADIAALTSGGLIGVLGK